MSDPKMKAALDSVLRQTTGRHGGAPGVVAMVTDQERNIYEGAAGVREQGKQTPMDLDTVFAIFSTTKAITSVCALQLLEEGLLRLDDPVGKYLPEIDKLHVLEGFGADGQARLRPPKRRITVSDLLLQTSGLCYDFFSAEDKKYRELKDIPSIITCTRESIQTVLQHDPGEAWTYGVNTDWLGLVVEKLRGQRLGEVMHERVFQPLGMVDTAFSVSDDMVARRATIHSRAADGQLVPVPELALPAKPVMDMGGHGLYGTVRDYMKFIRMVLNDGAGEHGRVLKPETAHLLAKDGYADTSIPIGLWETSDPSLANSGEFMPGVDKGWSHAFMINREQAPTGRSPGSMAWTGLANSYLWIDKARGVGGYWATQILPFYDCASYPGFYEFEATTYNNLN
ncbi:serine hydrolase [Marinobacter sp. 2_MG-2023]|uniref:serine hydrolase domain-containing protein n=1 Tax=Marinobacter sp. 2_MG-2023 TaxID=3062679 RepID=UPI0026E117EE|nr:serine hydrolase domain-containing protein [Marinobacter sp. 2_MG-2023]MDO6442611.1 serine hydrolase domain-containing protein [Marinobacter sp. 2_MG-2023]